VGEGWKIRQSVLNSGEKIQRFPRTLDQIQLGGGDGKSEPECFLYSGKKFKGSRGHLVKFSGGGVENQTQSV